MKFWDIQYKRPDIEVCKEQFNKSLLELEKAEDEKAAVEAVRGICELRKEFESMSALAYVRHTIDTTNKFYEDEQEYFDINNPVYSTLVSKFYKLLVKSPFKEAIGKEFKEQLINIAEVSEKSFSDEVVTDSQEENKLASEYTKLIASAKIDFEGEERNLSQMTPFQQSTDRAMRKKACEAKFGFYAENQDKIDDIYDKLVKVRTRTAKKLGYKNFVQLGYDRLNRTDYDAEKVAVFRDQVVKYIVPLAEELKKRQAKRLGLESLKFYDESFEFLSGNPMPKGDKAWMVNHAKTMYNELSKETGEFFTHMIENDMMDLDSKKGKAGGGYCHFFSTVKSPFIFANFNGTSGDVGVLTHEAGHAFQAYTSRGYDVTEYAFPTYEASEIHSMSMEFLTWPWMKLFFEEDEMKYKFEHLASAITFIPYGVCVDEFQHFVYDNPEATPVERRAKWRELQRKYEPGKDFDGFEFLENGGWWFGQRHIFESPFYYIDYTLAQICALQFWKKANDDRANAWNDYMNLCKQGGSESFLKLIDRANLISPFDPECIKSIISSVKAWLDSVDDTKL
ncbi:oligoendopeptidase, M3 family [Hathewaya proteolytica DSM 3090]|uniref:Oligoendopeptidase, M3 family n=1 Tax=Hathewaya proteolytica DSM 3090 TaxID=1121331 RepID=A0A1M6SBT5_9CLOT|nr:M3 family oligoendopeptidase [Hathewaya proteolytica]SHK42242.1 oligoendopeptidase, M3 family [Hathewaya proteolytica DSM 3090]